jgi:glycosyltransferase involved in cell wall biosynthesis
VPNPCRTYDRHEYIKTVSGCDIFLTLGYYEPFGLMYVESAMLGVLPISTNVGITKLLWPRKTLGSYIDNDSNHEITLNRTADILRLVLKDINIRHRALSETNRNLHEMYSKSFNIVEALKVTLNDWLCIIK